MLWKEKAKHVFIFRVRLVMLFLQATNGNQTHAYDTFSTHNGKGDPAPLGRKFAGEHTRRPSHRTLQKVWAPSLPPPPQSNCTSQSRLHYHRHKRPGAITLRFYSLRLSSKRRSLFLAVLVPSSLLDDQGIKWPTTTTTIPRQLLLRVYFVVSTPGVRTLFIEICRLFWLLTYQGCQF